MIQRLVFSAALTAVSALAQGSPGVPASVFGLAHPASLQAGDRYRILTVTDSVRDATSPDAAVYDAFVTADANAAPWLAGLNTNWRAFVATPSTSAREHTEMESGPPGPLAAGFPIFNPGRQRIADDYQQLFASSSGTVLYQPPTLTSNLQTTSTRAWTGSPPNGLASPNPGSEMGNGTVLIGNPNALNAQWVTAGARPASWQLPLYGVSDLVTVQARLPRDLEPGDQYRIVFVTNSTRDATSTDIADYDSFVTADAMASPVLAALGTTWKAFASTSTVGALTHAELNGAMGGVPIYRTDGLRIADDYSQFATSSIVDRPPAVTAAGSLTSEPECWTGFSAGQTLGTAGNVATGDPMSSSPWQAGSSRPSTDSLPLYGISAILTVPTPHPAELQPGDQYRVMLITDGARNATSANIADYDAFVTTDALASQRLSLLDTTWQALASTQFVNARTHTGTTGNGGVPIFRPDGVRLANDYVNLWNPGFDLLATPTVTPTLAVRSDPCWTGTGFSGFTEQPLGSGSGLAKVGSPDSVNSAWLAFGPSPLSPARPLYGISAVITVPYPSQQIVRTGNPANANALLPGQTSPPVIGETWDPIIDHTTFATNAALDFAMFGIGPFNAPVPNLGTVLVDQLFGSISVTPGQPFLLALPNNTDLLGTQMSVQGLTLDWTWGLHLTNALDITVGTH